jgi:hypothetical protein
MKGITMSAARNTNSAARQIRCPRCLASPGALCRNAQGQPLAGVHIERQGSSRRAISAALSYYAGLGLRTKGGRE